MLPHRYLFSCCAFSKTCTHHGRHGLHCPHLASSIEMIPLPILNDFITVFWNIWRTRTRLMMSNNCWLGGTSKFLPFPCKSQAEYNISIPDKCFQTPILNRGLCLKPVRWPKSGPKEQPPSKRLLLILT